MGGMERRISLVTLGYADLDRSRRFYEALGWRGTSPGDDGTIRLPEATP